ncbi:MAG: UDP-N-acetylmuramoyl-L-alanine--D-glutamate ligase [Puniceicoccaceae bacterium]|nr:MAG: UDP-N-acetylmuramoyl-L-alanine--D-glutamate ligase [Puniceicoccaceae bacterium]
MQKKIAIFGAGQSGQSARRLARSLGYSVVLYDEGGQGDAVTLSEHDLAAADLCVFSPGFAAAHAWRRRAIQTGLPCLSELAFAAAHWQGPIIGVTGTNGKTTLTTLLAEALAAAGHSSVATGNIGYPLSDAVLSDANQPGAYAVVEISSFQAELSQELALDGLLWTNFAEDHLDRYASMAAYFEAKAQLLKCLTPGAHCVLGPELAPWMQQQAIDCAACQTLQGVDDLAGMLSEDSVFRRRPNVENFSLAARWWQLSGWPLESLIAVANESKLPAHRLSVVAEWGGVRFWNDTKATNFHAALAAIESVGAPIVWIGGGRGKGGDVEGFARKVAAQVDAAVLYGEMAQSLAVAMQGQLSTIVVHERFEDAVHAAAGLASSIPAANVLLSPGFASFDQFSSYSARGKMFKELVLSLKNPQRFC